MAGIMITAHQPARRHRRRRPAAGDAVRRGRPALLAADGRRRPVRADPGAADLGRHRHHRHPLGLRGRPRHRHRRPDPRPAQGAAGRRRRDLRVRARPGPAEDPVPRHRRPVLRRRLDAAQDRRAAAAGRGGRRRASAAAPPAGELPAPRDAALERARARPARARDRLRPGAAGRPAAPAARCSRASATIRRQIASELGMVIPPVRIRDDVGLDSHEYVVQGARHRGRARRRHGRATSWRWTRATPSASCPASRRPSRPSACPRSGSPTPRRAEAEALGYTVVDPESVVVTHLTETIRAPRRRAAHPPGDAHAARPAQGGQRGGRRGGRARRALASARSSACCRRCCARASRSATSARSSRRSATRRASRATRRCSPSTPARRSAARSSRRTWTPSATLRAIALDPALEQEVAECDRADRRRRVPRDGPARAQALVRSCAEQVEQALARGRPAGAAVLGARAAPPAPALRAGAAAARGLLLQRDRARRRRRDDGRRRRRPCPPTHAGGRVADRSEVPVVAAR